MILHRSCTRAVALGAVVSIALTPAPARAAQRFGPDDVNRIVGLSSPQLAPDGKRAIVVVSRIDVDKDTYDRELDLIDVRTHERRPLTFHRKGLSDPQFSPQGDRIAFLAEDGTGDDAKAQIFVLRLDGGDARPVSSAPAGVEQFAWRPDGAAFAYVAEDAMPKPTAPLKFHDSFVVTNNPITAHAAARPLHVWTLSLGGGATKQLTKDPVRSVVGGEAAGASPGRRTAKRSPSHSRRIPNSTMHRARVSRSWTSRPA
jgi:dipeptidyl aminopeptidase/acylaminoacyl peptidase